jgi:WXG100 family type VII secretion target
MSIIQVNFAQMQTTSTNLRNAHGALAAHTAEHRADMATLVGGWRGLAGDQHTQVEALLDRFNAVSNELLHGIHTNVDTAHQNFLQAETANAKGWSH